MQNRPGPRIYLAHNFKGIYVVYGYVVLSGVPMLEVHLPETPLIPWLQVALEIEPKPSCP